ncbi:MAG: hypothetical protein ABSF54_09445 [Bryobacteraceae bacterium]
MQIRAFHSNLIATRRLSMAAAHARLLNLRLRKISSGLWKSSTLESLAKKATRKGTAGTNLTSLHWSDCPFVEVIPGKVSGALLLKNTRLPVDAITGNYDAFRAEGLSPDAAIAETLDCYPEAGLDAIKAILNYRAAHQFQEQV